MLGFAVVDRQPSAATTAVWLTSRVEDSRFKRDGDSDELKSVRVNHTNAVVIAHDDERYETKMRSLTADRAVVLTTGTVSPVPFVRPLTPDVFDVLIKATVRHQQRIDEAVEAARTATRKLVDPDFPRAVPELIPGERDEPQFRALATADYVAAVWRLWLLTDAQRVRRSLPTKTKTRVLPPIMPEELCDPKLTELPPKFAELAAPEPVTR
ncbi:hypothetical protein [Mycolicibacter icosiumassiliensis]|uniref:hypothetical protein n=1 Tax=Mycolicibacter icosiumassiliensis TaxID=1792835 RepID=UPI0008364699|nr:hypothetical protein [Mycolicibacter icosiumassiliensis]